MTRRNTRQEQSNNIKRQEIPKEQISLKEEYNNHLIFTEQPNEINPNMRVIVTTMHGTHLKEWIIGSEGIKKAKEFIDGMN